MAQPTLFLDPEMEAGEGSERPPGGMSICLPVRPPAMVQRMQSFPLLAFSRSDLVQIEPLAPLRSLRRLQCCQRIAIAAEPVGRRHDITLSAPETGTFARITGFRDYPSIEFTQRQQSALLWSLDLHDPYQLILLFPGPVSGVPDVSGPACSYPLGLALTDIFIRQFKSLNRAINTPPS